MESQITELLPIVGQIIIYPKQARKTHLEEFIKSLPDGSTKRDLSRMKQIIESAGFIEINGFSKDEIEDYQSSFAKDFYPFLHLSLETFTKSVNEKILELDGQTHSLNSQYLDKTKQSKKSKKGTEIKLIQLIRYKEYLENLLIFDGIIDRYSDWERMNEMGNQSQKILSHLESFGVTTDFNYNDQNLDIDIQFEETVNKMGIYFTDEARKKLDSLENLDDKIRHCRKSIKELKQKIETVKFIDEQSKHKNYHHFEYILLKFYQSELEFLEYEKPFVNKIATTQNNALKVKQIALINVYEGNQITRKNADEIAAKYGYISGEGLFQDFTYYSSTANRKGKPIPYTSKKMKNKIQLFESVLSKLSANAQKRAMDEIQILKTQYESDNL